MKWRRVIIAFHRDLGYFFAGAAILFSISGLAVNHAKHWDPDFIVARQEVSLSLPEASSALNRETIATALEQLPVSIGAYRTHDFPTKSKVKIYLDDGSILVNLASGHGQYESVRPRPILYAFNRLHLDPSSWWLIFSDAFAVSLIVLAITGILILRGKNGLFQRGKWLVGAGLVIPILGIVFFG